MRNKRELRQASKSRGIIELKGDLRGTKINANATRVRMQDQIDRRIRESETFQKVALSALGNIELKGCRDQLVDEILGEVLKAVEVVARETLEPGEYRMSLNIPQLSINRMLRREGIEMFGGSEILNVEEMSVRRIDIQMFEKYRGE
jgi:hypothetical protein